MMKKICVMILSLAFVFISFSTGCSSEDKGGKLWIGMSDNGYGVEWVTHAIETFEDIYPEYKGKIIIKHKDAKYSQTAEMQLQSKSTEDDLLLIENIYFIDYAINNEIVNLDEVYAEAFDNSQTIADAMFDGAKTESMAVGPDGQWHYYVARTNSAIQSLVVNKTVIDYYEKSTWWGTAKKLLNATTASKKITTVPELNAWVEKIESLSETHPFTYKNGKGESGSVKGFVYPGQYINYWESVGNTWWVQSSGYSTFQDFFKLESSSVYNDTGRKDAYQAFESLDLQNHAVTGSISMSHIEAQNAFIEGRAAIIPNGAWIYNESKNYIDSQGVEIEMISVPYPTTAAKSIGEQVLYAADGNLAIIPNRKDVNISLAKKFLAHLLSQEESVFYTSSTGGIRPFEGYADDLTIADVSEFTLNVIELMKNKTLIHKTPSNPQVSPNWRMIRTGKAPINPTGSPWSQILNGATGEAVFNAEIKNANSNFSIWKQLAGM